MFITMILLLLPFLFSTTYSCLVIRSPTTTPPTTTIPQCSCPLEILTNRNLETYIVSNPFYYNISSRPIYNPKITDESDGCSKAMYCERGYSLVVFDKNGAKYEFYDRMELYATCDPSNKQWFLDDGVHEMATFTELYVACVDYVPREKCPCFFSSGRYPEDAAFLEEHTTYRSPFFENNVTKYEWYSPDVIFNDQNCPTNVTCPDNLTHVEISYYIAYVSQVETYNCTWPAYPLWEITWNGMPGYRDNLVTPTHFRYSVCVDYNSPIIHTTEPIIHTTEPPNWTPS